MRSAILGVVLGIACLQMQAVLPSAPLAVALLTALLSCVLLVWRVRRWRWLRLVALVSGGALAGFLWAAWIAQWHLQEELPFAWEGRDITLIGTVDSLPQPVARGVRFNFKVEQVVAQGDLLPPVPARLALAWYAPRVSAVPDDESEELQRAASPLAAVPTLQAGARWQLTVRLKRPHGNANPNGFDYEVWLLEQNLRATGYVRTTSPADNALATANRQLDAFVWSSGNAVEYVRGWLRDRILAALPGHPYAGVIVALVIGDQRAVSQSDWQVFNRTGVGHLLAISGLHITLVAGLFAALMQALWRRSFFTGAQLPLRLPAQKAGVLAGLAAALLYVLLAGFGIPAQRTVCMLAVVGAAAWLGRLTQLSHVMCLALLAVLLLDPWALLWPGFWLSFGTVGLILYASVGRTAMLPATTGIGLHERRSHWQRWLQACRNGAYTQYVVSLGLLPLTMLLFAQYSLVSPLANAVAIPLVALLVTPLALLGCVLPPPLSAWVWQLAHQCVVWLAAFLQWLSSLPFAVWSAPLPPFWMFALALAGTLLLLAPRGWPARWLGWFGWLPLLVNAPLAPAPGTMQVTAFDVGQGTAVLVETANHRLLYDTGAYYTPQSDGGNRVIVPYLRSRGISELDTVVISHSDNDHSGGAASVFKAVEVARVYSSLPLTHALVQQVPDHRRCQDGQHWRWDEVDFTMLHPAAVSYDSDKWKPNARSCVLKVSAGGQSILLTGDIEAVQEDQLVHGARAADLAATVLLAPHHGSATSSTLPFLQAVKPQLALFQVGYRNRFHHPRPDVVDRYGRLGIERLRSDESGAVTLQFGEALEVTEYRREHARYWYGR